MTTSFTLATKTRLDTFTDTASVGDVVKYSFDCSPWAEDNAAISAATWTVESGQASISGQALVSNVVTANITFSQSSCVLISILISTNYWGFIIAISLLSVLHLFHLWSAAHSLITWTSSITDGGRKETPAGVGREASIA